MTLLTDNRKHSHVCCQVNRL